MNSAQLISATRINPALTVESVAGISDLSTLFQHSAPFAERLIEYAGRVCYRSTEKMGHAPGFIQARIKEGHEDIVEHVSATLYFPFPLAAGLRSLNRHVDCSPWDRGAIVTGNLRAWRDLLIQFSRHDDDIRHPRAELLFSALPILRGVAPNVFSGIEIDAPDVPDIPVSLLSDRVNRDRIFAELLSPVEDSQTSMRVTLLGVNQNDFGPSHNTATFLFEGISRTCTHQLVRHRLGSFSQESQRYVELSKGGWEAIVPPSISSNPEALKEMSDFWRVAEAKYARLRSLGILKEDARFILPNAAETRIVVTMSFEAWRHFFWLRAVDKAAQWEIRTMARYALCMLYSVSPDSFRDQFDNVLVQETGMLSV